MLQIKCLWPVIINKFYEVSILEAHYSIVHNLLLLTP